MNTHPQHADAVWPGPDSRYRKLPLFGPVIDEAVAWLRQEGYTDATVRGYFKCLGQLVRWLQQRCGPRLERLTQGDLDAAYAGFHRRAPGLAGSVRTWARFLRGQRRIRECPQTPRTPSELELARFSAHLRRTRALAASTVTGHESRLRGFLQFLKYDQVPGGLRTLSLPRVEAFIRHAARTNNRFSLQHVVASLRSFLRYQHARGVLRPPLHQRIDTPRTYRLEQLPRALPWDRVVALLRSIDHSHPAGRRDFALLYLAARYGLRSGELVRLTLDDLIGVTTPSGGSVMAWGVKGRTGCWER